MMKYCIGVTLLVTILFGCSLPHIQENSTQPEVFHWQKKDVFVSDTTIQDFPIVDFKISIEDTVLNYGDKIVLNINLVNKNNQEQKLLFDKPAVSTGGIWMTSGSVINAETKESMLEYENKAILSSQIYFEEELKDKYYCLKPNQSIGGQYKLTDFVVFNSPENLLPKGIYKVQLFYYNNPSNIITVEIR